MLALAFLSACSDYQLLGDKSGDEDTGSDGVPEDPGIEVTDGADYPIETLISDCVALDADNCPDNDDEGGDPDATCAAWTTPRRDSMDRAAQMLLDDLNSGVTGIGVYSVFHNSIPTTQRNLEVEGLSDNAAIALIAGGEDEIADAVSEWESETVTLDNLDAFPLDAIVCRVERSEFDSGDATYQFVQGHQTAGEAANDVDDAIIVNVSDMPLLEELGYAGVSLTVMPEFAPEDAESYQYVDEELPYDIDGAMVRGEESVTNLLTTAEIFSGRDTAYLDQATWSRLTYYGAAE